MRIISSLFRKEIGIVLKCIISTRLELDHDGVKGDESSV